MSESLISIITPVYNSDKFIVETIKSIINQSYRNWELILIDDGSSDYSVDIIQALIRKEQDARIQLILHSRNSGVATARNTGIKLAKGEYIAFIDSDDIWDIDKLDYQLNFMIKHNCTICHTAYRKIDIHGKLLVAIVPVSNFVDYHTLLKHNEMGLSTVMYNAQVLGKREFTTTGWEDFSLWLSILKDTRGSFGIKKPLVSYRIHRSSSSHNKLKSAKKTWDVYRQVEQFSFVKSVFYFSCYAVSASIKYVKK